MKKFIALIIIIAIILSAPYLSVSASQAIPTQNALPGSCKSLDADQALLGSSQLTDNAASIVLYETNSQTMMYAWNSDAPTNPASLVKIMTGLIVAEKGNMLDAVTVSAEALSSISSDAATADLQIDEVLTVESLMYCMLVSSANDAAAVLAEYVAGSQPAFVDMMNEYADNLGCTGTHFVNVHGLYDENQYSTARDLAKILDAALKNEFFRKVFGTVSYSLPATNKHDARDISTGNFLMSTDDVQVHYDERVTGGRTGIDHAGYRSLATVAQSGNMELICILLGAESQIAEDGYSVRVFGGYTETSNLLSKGFNDMHLVQVVRENQIVAQKRVEGGECDVVLAPAESVFAVLPTNVKTKDLSYRYVESEQLKAPIVKGNIVSTVEIWHNNLCVAKTDLYAMNSVDVLNMDIEGVDDVKVSGGPVFWIVLIIIVAAVLLLFAIRFISRFIRKRRRMKMRQYRRRSR